MKPNRRTRQGFSVCSGFDLKDIQFIYFDIDDTLLDHKSAQEDALVDVFHRFQEHFGSTDLQAVQRVYHIHNVALWTQYAHGEIDRPYLQQQRFLRLLRDLDITSVPHEEVSAYYMQQYAEHWTYCEGAYETFTFVADRYPVGVLTNGFTEVQHAKLARFSELRDRLASTVISEEVGYMKPHPELFKHAAKKADTAPEKILYIGDSYSSDIQGGLNAGWHVIWYNPQATEIPNGVNHIRNLKDLKEMV